MIDSHCHLDQEPLLNDIDAILKRSKNEGLTNLLTISTTLKSFEQIKKIVFLDKIIFGTFGIHPHETNTNIVTKTMIKDAINNHDKIIGVGETGLDFFYNHSDKDRQIKSFKDHIESAIELNLPIIIHSRNAEKETFEILNSYKKDEPKILMHCFTGSEALAKKLLTLDAFFSASGIITFKNSGELQKTFKNLPLDKLLVETDSPYLAPSPMRGKKNEPSFIKYTIQKLADLKEIKLNDMVIITTNNFKKLFNLL